MTTTKLRTLKISEWDLMGWSSALDTAAQEAHTLYHGAAEYPAAWDRCWAEPCRSLIQIADDINNEVVWADDTSRAGSG